MHLAIVSNIGANTTFNSTMGKKDGKHPQQQNGEHCDKYQAITILSVHNGTKI